MSRGGERFGLIGTEAGQPRTGERQLMRIAAILSGSVSQTADTAPDFGAPPRFALPRAGRAIFFSDFMGPRDQVFPALMQAAGQGIGGIYVQILDPVEEDFPLQGRTRFESVGRVIRHETDQAGALRDLYLARLAERRADLAATARRAGWHLIPTPHGRTPAPRPAGAAHHPGGRLMRRGRRQRSVNHDGPGFGAGAGRPRCAAWQTVPTGAGWGGPLQGTAMLSLGAIGFLNPWLLAGLAALPVLWWLLRAIPPSPKTEVFAGVRLLLGLEDPERQAAKTTGGSCCCARWPSPPF